MPTAHALDDAVTVLLQLEPDDRDELARVRETLADLLLDARVAVAAQPLVARAVRALAPLADGTAADPAGAFAESCALLERAMTAAPPVPAAPARRSPASSAAAAPAPSAVPDALPPDLDAELLRDFLAESRELAAASEAALLALERAPGDGEALDTVFRAFHTVKGTAGFLGLERVGGVAHEAESLLAGVRDGGRAYTPAVADLALRAVDMIRALLDAVEATAADAAADGVVPIPDGYDALLGAIGRALAGDDRAAGDRADDGGATGRGAGVGAPPRAHPDVPADERVDAGDRREGERRGAERRAGERRAGDRRAAADAGVRVRTDRLDALVDMVGELVVAHTVIAGDPALAAGERRELARRVAHAGKIVRGLQDLAMSMRMVPLRPTFQKLERVARDVAARTGKDVELVTVGEDTELDRTVVDVIGDPLVHMVRNALDHGVEPPAERVAAGKPARGRVTLSARQAGGGVVVELRDDGRGLSRDRILRKALERGLVDPDRALSDAEVFALVLAPGFSTAEQVTDISGRGVGMDVVKRNVESVRGRIEIESVPGAGTTFRVLLPLTLAVTDGMLVRVGAERYVVPTTSVHMSFRPEPGMLQTVGGRGEVAVLRGEVLPIVRLHRLFDEAGAEPDPTRAILVIVGDGVRRRSALLVDELLGQQQVVAKSLGDRVGAVPGIAGGAVLGDGRVGLVLDVAGVLALAEGTPVPDPHAAPSPAHAVA